MNEEIKMTLQLSKLYGAKMIQISCEDVPNYTLEDIQKFLGEQTDSLKPLSLTAIANILKVKLRKVKKWAKGKPIPYAYRLALHLLIEGKLLSKIYKIETADFHWVEEE